MQLVLCSIVMQNIQIFCGVLVMSVVTFLGVVVVKNGCGLLNQWTLKSSISQELFDELIWYLHADTNLGKLNVNLIIIGCVYSKMGETF